MIQVLYQKSKEVSDIAPKKKSKNKNNSQRKGGSDEEGSGTDINSDMEDDDGPIKTVDTPTKGTPTKATPTKTTPKESTSKATPKTGTKRKAGDSDEEESTPSKKVGLSY